MITDGELSALRVDIGAAEAGRRDHVTINLKTAKRLLAGIDWKNDATIRQQVLTDLIGDIHACNVEAGWWHDPETGEELLGNPMVEAAKLLLIHSELSEAVEFHRKGGTDDHLKEFPGLAVEMADVFIRWADMVGALGLTDIMAHVIQRKREYNRARTDHSRSARVATGGKKY